MNARIHRLVFLLVMFFHAMNLQAADPPKAEGKPAAPKLDTSRGDRMIADYFRAETARLADACLADIKTLDDWKARRDLYRQQLFEMLGLSPLPKKTDLKAVVTGVVDQPGFTVEKVHFQSSPGLYVTGDLYIPKGLSKPAPAILYVCGHGGVKKNNISYGNKTYYTHHGSWFARHGYVCLTIDSLQLGEIEGIHHGTYRYGMWWWLNRGYTPAGVEAWNCIRALDYLETRKEVDKNRFGVTGRSGGGAYSWWIAAIDERIKVAVPGAGITDLTNHVVDGCVEGHCDCMYMHNTYRWDYAQVAALVAPRPLLISNTDKDNIFPLDGVVRLHSKVAHIYKLHGAEKNLGLNIVEGPHKDSQELQVGSFVWFDRFLGDGERPIDKPALKMLEPEQLRVFGDKLPEDQINTKIQDTFVAAHPPIAPPANATAFKEQTEMWMKALREQVFRGWPSDKEAGPLEVKEAFAVEADGLRLVAYDFNSQPTVRLRLYVLLRKGAGKLVPDLVDLTVLDEEGWLQWRQAMEVKFADAMKGEMAVDADERGFEVMRGALNGKPGTLAWVCPRGVGPTAWDQSEKKQTQHRRRFMLLGQTLDGMRVWDIRRAIQALDVAEVTKGAPVFNLRGARVMAGNVLYASLFEDRVLSVNLQHLKPTHQEGPIYMNINKHIDIPQAAAMAAARGPLRPLRLEMALPGDWNYLTATATALGLDKKRFSMTISPPPAGPPR